MPKTKVCCKTTIYIAGKNRGFPHTAALKLKNEEKAFFSNSNFKAPPNTLISFPQL